MTIGLACRTYAMQILAQPITAAAWEMVWIMILSIRPEEQSVGDAVTVGKAAAPHSGERTPMFAGI